MQSTFTLPRHGTADAMDRSMNASLQAKVRRVFIREFYRRGCLTWDMKMALRLILSER
jgi:hypothetical protein